MENGGIIPSAPRGAPPNQPPPRRAQRRGKTQPPADPTRPGGTASAGRAELTHSLARPPGQRLPSLVAFRALVRVCMCRRGRESTTRHRASRAECPASAIPFPRREFLYSPPSICLCRKCFPHLRSYSIPRLLLFLQFVHSTSFWYLSNWFYKIFTGTAPREQPAVVLLFGVGSDRTRCWL
jgi:hypothetical protein